MVGFGVGKVLYEKSIKQANNKKDIRRSVADYDVIGGALTDMALDEAKDFLQLLRSRPYQRKSKVFSNKELRILVLVNILEEWNQHSNENVSQYDLVFQLDDVLTAILNERKKKRVRLEVRTLELLKTSLLKCTEILAAKDAEEEKKKSRDNFEGERRAEETSNGGDYPIFGEAMNFEKVKENLFIINAQKRRLLNVLAEHHHIVEAIKEEFPSPTIRSDLDKGLESFVDHYQYLNSKLDELSAHYNGMIKQWFS